MTNIKNPDYSKEARMALLQDVVEDGYDAEAAYPFALRLKKEFEKQLLDKIASGKNSEQEQVYYQVACRFCGLLEQTVSNGKRKEKVLTQLKGEY